MRKPHGPMPRGGGKPTFKISTLKRVIKMLYSFYPIMLPITIVCIIFNAIVAAIPAIFQQQIIADIQTFYRSGDWSAA
ncbi:MAG: hypothetical protein ACI4U6_01505, partial [Acutalibacteraceae bacterium]